jgi:hypothetical protein
MGRASLLKAINISIPLIGEGKTESFKKIINGFDADDICPILPFPSCNLRRSDNLLWEYCDIFTNVLMIEAHNILYVDEKNPFELYAIKSTERNGRAPLEGDVVTDAKDSYDQFGKPAVSMSMNSEGSRRWALMTKQNIGKAIAIVLDGYVYSAPNVNSEITGGNSEITGHFTPEESKDLANVLKSGKMPAPAHIVQEDIIGPSLGQESINAGLISFLVATAGGIKRIHRSLT